ncbi:MAG: cytochrome c biogenesis CcdA family protein [Pseudolabrys sp.]
MSLDVTAGGAFLAGLLSFASPCVLPLVPAYLAYIGGVSVDDLRKQGGRARVMLAALAFVAGFSTVFVALGATASSVGQAVSAYIGWLSFVAGALIVLMGLHFLHVLRLPLIDRSARVGVAAKPAGLIGAYLIGLAFGFGWSPCVGPVLAAILLIAGAQESAGEGARLLLIYSLGIGAPFMAAAAFAGAFMRAMARWRAHMGVVEKAMGALLVVTGVLIFTGQMATIAFWLIEVFPALGRIG